MQRALSAFALRGLWILWGLSLLSGSLCAHPLSQGTLAVVVHPGRVDIRARVTVEEAVITATLAGPENLRDSDRPSWHAQYLASHLQVSADGQPYAGRVVAVHPPGHPPPGTSDPDPAGHAVYDLVYTPESPAAMQSPRQLELRQDVLVGVELAPGVAWEASYTVGIGRASGRRVEGLLLDTRSAVVHTLRETTGPLPADAPAAAVDRGTLFRDYLAHGFHHILAGYDHLLFIGALVLAARRIRDLVLIVTAFTAAHTLTLTLAALQLIALPPAVVEPMIALSIVVVAAQNALWPRQSRGRLRLAIAAGFGLFHGLGFAGGLLDVMQAMSGWTIVLAIAAFSVGVELGHQLIVIPLYAALRFGPGMHADVSARERFALRVQRWGSAVIVVAGLYYLGVALHSVLGVSAA